MHRQCASSLDKTKSNGEEKTRKERFYGDVSLLGQGETLRFQRLKQWQTGVPEPFFLVYLD